MSLGDLRVPTLCAHESPKLLDLIEMDAHALPEQMATLGDDPAYADRGGERHTQRRAVADLDDPVAALALLWFADAPELDQVRTAGLLLAELEPAACDLEVGIALRDRAARDERLRAAKRGHRHTAPPSRRQLRISTRQRRLPVGNAVQVSPSPAIPTFPRAAQSSAYLNQALEALTTASSAPRSTPR